MPTHNRRPADDKDRVQLLVGDQEHDDWERYEIDSDLLVPADAWQLVVGLPQGIRPPEVAAGAKVAVRIGGDLVMTGRIDQVSLTVAHGQHSFSIAGRDGAAVLVDCSAPVFVARLVTLDEIISKIVRPLGIKDIRVDAATKHAREKVNVEPGDTAWDVLAHAAEANGLWPWFEPDGTLVVGGPDYLEPPVADLVLRYDGAGNNVQAVSHVVSIADRYSHLTVLGQTHGTATENGKHALRHEEKDEAMVAIQYRPKIVIDHESDNKAIAAGRARKLLADSRLRGTTITVRVKGHRIDAPGMAGHGRLWSPGQRVNLLSQPHGLDGIYFIMGRRFVRSREDGTITELTLKEDKTWVLDAHPHKRRHRRGRNGLPDDFKEVAK